MSYNIDTFKLKRLEDLKIPYKSFFKHERKDWHPEVSRNEDGSTTLWICETGIIGFVENDIFNVTKINIQGEGSGCALYYILEGAFKDSTGILEASCIWEGGDSVNKLIVNNGNVKWIDIEI